MRTGKYINTFTGICFYPLDPKYEEIQTMDIGHALSMICRGNGHYSHFYSVAQHSLYCAEEAENRGFSIKIQLACLLHDASEAYISDITRPVKGELARYLDIEEHLQNAIYQAYGLANLTSNNLESIKTIDTDMLHYEMKALLQTDTACNSSLSKDYNLSFRDMHDIKLEYIQKVTHLSSKLPNATL